MPCAMRDAGEELTGPGAGRPADSKPPAGVEEERSAVPARQHSGPAERPAAGPMAGLAGWWSEGSRTPASRQHSGTRFLNCPELERAVRGSDQVRNIMDEVTVHYGASFSVLTWRSQGDLCLKANHLEDVFCVPQAQTLGEYQLFNHTIDRDLPIVVYDVAQHEVYGKVALPDFANPTRFYVAAPLISPTAEYVGTLCVVDSDRPRAEFYMRDVAFLEQKARELVKAAEEYSTLLQSSGEAAGSLAETGPGIEKRPEGLPPSA